MRTFFILLLTALAAFSGDDIPAGEDYVGLKVPDGVSVDNAWNGAGSKPSSIGWTAEGKLPEDSNELSYARSVYDDLGRVKMSIALDEYGYEQPTSYEYDAAGRQTAVIDPCGYRTETYYQGGRRASVVDARGFDPNADPNDYKTRFVYDDAGRVVSTIHPASVFADSNGAENTYTHVGFDALGRKLWQCGQTTQEDPNIAADSNESRWFEYDAAGRLTTVVLPPVDDPNDDPDQGETVNPRNDYFYDDHGNMAGIWDPNLRLTVFKYDQLHNQTHRYMPFKHTSSITSVDDIYSIDLSDKEFSLSEYDELSRLVKVTDFNDHITIYEYNNRSQLEYECHYESEGDYNSVNPTHNANPEIYCQYDKLGKRTSIIVTDYNSIGGVINTRETNYYHDNEGRTELVDSPEGVLYYQYDMITGRKTDVNSYPPDTAIADIRDGTESGTTWVQYTYDQLGRLQETTVLRRDGQLLSTPEVTTQTYDEVGNRYDMLLDNGVTTDYTYNSQNHLTDITHNTSTSNLLSSYTYKLAADGMRVELIEKQLPPGGTPGTTPTEDRTISYTYDNLNRIKVEDANDANDSYKVEYKYDLVGNHTERKVTSNGQLLTTTSTYDPNTDRLTKEVHDGPEYSFVWNNQRVYAYAGNGKITHYRLHGSSNDIGQIRAFFIGLPSKWSVYLFRAAMLFVVLAFFAPVLAVAYSKMRKHEAEDTSISISLYHRCVLVFLAYALLIGPFGFEQLSRGDTQYSQISTLDWSNGNRDIHYRYNDNGSLTEKITAVKDEADPDTNYIEKVTYDYNLLNRLERVITTYEDSNSTVDEITEYVYNAEGIRVQSESWSKIDDVDQQDHVTKLFLIDAYNHTGYAQVLERWTDGQSDPDVTYTIGDDIITQSTSAGVRHLLYDGHGSTRQLVDNSEGTANYYSYDAYGAMLGGNPAAGSSPATNLLYAGEHFDTDLQKYYLRARWYNQNNGRFNQMDTFAGDHEEPQSLHKYLYTHCNPVNNTDPSGKMTVIEKVTVVSITATVLSVIIPVVTGTILAVRAGVSPWEYFSELFSRATWKEALLALGIGTALSAVMKPLIKQLGKRAIAFIGLALSLWSLFNSIKLSIRMARNTQLTRGQIAHYMAVLTASTILAVVLGKMARQIANRRGRGYNRNLRRKLREEVMANAERTADGSFIDANTGKVIKGKYHFGHTYGREHRRLVQEALEHGMTQQEFDDWINSHVDWFQIEDPFSNMSHAFEKPG